MWHVLNNDSKMVGIFLNAVEKICISSDSGVGLGFRDASGCTPLHNACRCGFADIVKQLVEFQQQYSCVATLDINAASEDIWRTPLHEAVQQERLDIVKILLCVEGIQLNVEGFPSELTESKLIDNFWRLHGYKYEHKDQEVAGSFQPTSDSQLKLARASSSTPHASPVKNRRTFSTVPVKKVVRSVKFTTPGF